jgi:hypothetical protein
MFRVVSLSDIQSKNDWWMLRWWCNHLESKLVVLNREIEILLGQHQQEQQIIKERAIRAESQLARHKHLLGE